MINFFLLIGLIGGLIYSAPVIYVILSNKLENFNPNNGEFDDSKFI